MFSLFQAMLHAWQVLWLGKWGRYFVPHKSQTTRTLIREICNVKHNRRFEKTNFLSPSFHCLSKHGITFSLLFTQLCSDHVSYFYSIKYKSLHELNLKKTDAFKPFLTVSQPVKHNISIRTLRPCIFSSVKVWASN